MKTPIDTNQINIENKTPNYLAYGVYFLIYSLVLISTVLFFVYSDKSKAFSYNTLGFVLMTFAALSVSIFYYYPMLKNKNMNSNMVFILGGAILFASVFSYVGLVIDENSLNNIGIILLFLLIAIAIIGLAIVFYVFGDYLKQRRGIVGLIINFLFFIPCLFIDFVEFSKRQLNLTTRTEYILLFSEIILIIGYFFAAPLLNNAISSGTTYLLKSPVFLTKQKVLLKGTSSLAIPKNKNLTVINSSLYSSESNYSSNFSLSMWVYLNVQTKNFDTDNGGLMESTIFSYGSGKPKITYTNSDVDKSNRDRYNFYFTDSAVKPNHQASMPSQKWNYIVFNYSSKGVDLFINGILETTFVFDLTNRFPIYSDDDVIVSGQDKTGLYGAICNVVYTKDNLLNNQIVNNYNILRLKNPPILQI
jgi:hypothetical protein